ncbi:MAG TPA: PKD domain-containing protein [Iamia sp.]|nr:PKD domain-containing protein [Iamia sp.]
MLTALVVGLTAVVGVALPAPAPVTAAVSHPTLVRPTPSATTPHVTNGNVRTVAEVGDSVVIGGDFTASTDPDRTAVNRSFLLAFDKATGRIRRDWVPVLDNEVFSVVAAPDGQSVYVGGRFNRVNGVLSNKIARISMADGSRLPFQAGFDAVVTTMALQGDRLFVGGVFNNVQGRARRVVALDAQTGVVDDTMAVPFAGKHNGGDGKIWRIEASPDGQHVVVVGSFTTVGGQPRNQIAKLDVGATVTLSPWSTTAFSGRCANFSDYVRDVSYSPDSSYFVVVTTGAKGTGLNGTCDSVSRWEDTTQAGAGHTWIEYSGGDSYYSAEVTAAAIYVGGHFRWSNNSYGTDSLGPGGVATTGIASLDPSNGLPLSWNPGRDRGRAVWQLEATPTGLWVASDTDRIAGGMYRGRIAFFPLAGGKAVPQPPRPTLPATLEQYVPAAGGTAARVVQRSFDGTTVGTPQTAVANASALNGATAAFLADDVLYTAHPDGTLKARAATGTTLGAATNVDLQRMTAFATDLRNMRSALYDQGRLYYTVAGSGTLYMRYFSVENRVVGAQRFDVASSSGAVSYSNITGMVRFGDVVYFADLGTGALRKGTWRASGGIDPATVTTVSAANAGGISWTTSELWARPGPTAPANQAPVARTTVSCTGLRCTFDASTSTDADGTITGVAWAFSDGGTATGTTVTRIFAAPGTFTATATVTDDDGATGATSRSVTVADADPTARFTSSCTATACTFDASASTDADGTVTAYAWDFGDGSTGTGVRPTRTYSAGGTFPVRLTVTDDRGRTGTVTQPVTVTAAPAPTGSFVAKASRAGGTATGHTLAVPTQARSGDQLLLFVSTNAPGTTSVSAPAGWTRVLDAPTSGSRHAVFQKVAGTGDPGANVTVTLGTAARADVVIAAYRGLRVAPSGAASATGYVTPTRTAAAGDWVVSYWADKSATTAGWTLPTGTTSRHTFAGTGAGHVAEALADSGAGVAAGPVGGLRATVASPVANAVGITVLLRPV